VSQEARRRVDLSLHESIDWDLIILLEQLAEHDLIAIVDNA
jgi:hypothetical protein